MKRFYIILSILILSFIPTFQNRILQATDEDIKQPTAGGTFYPDNPQQLSQMIEGYLKTANPSPLNADIIALILPHAGYGFSGGTAAFAYKLIKDRPYKTVVIIGPSHFYEFSGISVYPQGIFRTPLGDLEIDSDFTKKLLERDKDITFEPEAFSKEHSVEVQLPFLQKTLSNFKIVPIVMGDCTLVDCQKLAGLLKEAIGSRKDVLVIASSDMYHGYDYQECATTDKATISSIESMDSQSLYYGLREEKAQLCGGFAVVTTIMLANDLGHKKALLLNHTNSAEVTGKKEKGIWTVGYSSWALDQDNKGEASMLTKEEKKKLLAIARSAIETYLKTGKKLEVKETQPQLLKECGAFVTLHKNGELRGCIGNIIGTQPLYLTIRDMAVESATRDPRFAPIEITELKDIAIEISLLSPLKRIASSAEIKMGEDGVLVKRGINSGVFLPQVARETGWSKEEFLSELCSQKAGLAPDAWKDKDTEIYIFSAEVFLENSY